MLPGGGGAGFGYHLPFLASTIPSCDSLTMGNGPLPAFLDNEELAATAEVEDLDSALEVDDSEDEEDDEDEKEEEELCPRSSAAVLQDPFE